MNASIQGKPEEEASIQCITNPSCLPISLYSMDDNYYITLSSEHSSALGIEAHMLLRLPSRVRGWLNEGRCSEEWCTVCVGGGGGGGEECECEWVCVSLTH